MSSRAALRQLVCKIVNVARPHRGEDDLARELASHLALLEDEFERRGLPPDEAQRAARLALGGVEQAKDRHRDARSFRWLDEARWDARYALRLLARNRIMAATAVLSLAIGIGANTAVFTVASAVLLRAPAGVAEPDRLVDIGVSRDDGGLGNASYPVYLDVRRRATTLAAVYARTMFPHALALEAGGGTGVERVFGHSVTTNYFTALGAVPRAGRLFDARDDDGADAGPVVVLSYGYWMRRFDGDPSVIGRAVRINDRAFTIAGVAEEGFQGTGVLSTDIWVPLNAMASASQRESMLTNRSNAWLVMGGRLRPGVALSAAVAEIEIIGRDLVREYGERASQKGLRLLASSSVPGSRVAMAMFVTLLVSMVAVVLLVACANVAGILLARAAARRREVAVRLAIGAGRARLVRQLLIETAVLFLLGGAAGLVLARVMTSALVRSLPALPFPISVSLALDVRAVAFTVGLSLVAAVLSGLVPALQASKTDVVDALKDDVPGPLGRSRIRHLFVVAQVAFSVLLVVAAGLFTRALQRAGSIDPGFDPRGVELVSLDVSMAGYTDATGPGFWRELADRVRELPNVEASTIARTLPGGFEGIGLGGVGSGDAMISPSWNIVEPGYFATLRIPLVSGRDFSIADRAGGQLVAIVAESLARRLWPDGRAVGRQLLWRDGGPTASTNALSVVGVARDVKSTSLIDGMAEPFVYLPLQQHYASRMTATMTLAVRTSDGRSIAAAVRQVVASIDSRLPIVTSQRLDESVALGLVPQRVAASVSGSLGLAGLLLAAVGMYGVTMYAVLRRTREFGIRIAVGARRIDIVGMVLRQGMTTIAIGGVIGLLLGAAVGQLLTAFLYGLPPLDPFVFGAAAAACAGVGLIACYAPARHATRVDPLVALRHE